MLLNGLCWLIGLSLCSLGGNLPFCPCTHLQSYVDFGIWSKCYSGFGL